MRQHVKREIGGTNKPSKHSLIIRYRGYSRRAQITPLILGRFDEKGIHLCADEPAAANTPSITQCVWVLGGAGWFFKANQVMSLQLREFANVELFAC